MKKFTINASAETKKIFDYYTEMSLIGKKMDMLQEELERLQKKREYIKSEFYYECHKLFPEGKYLHLIFDEKDCTPETIIVKETEVKIPKNFKDFLDFLKP